MGCSGTVTCRNAKGCYPTEFRVSWFASTTPCPRATPIPGLQQQGTLPGYYLEGTLPGYYFEMHSQISQHYVSIGFKLKDQDPPFLYEYGSGGRSDTGLGFSVPGGKCTELWKCDPVPNLKEDESGILSFPPRVLRQVMGAGVNWAQNEVFFTRNGELTWLLVGALQERSCTKLYPAMSLDWSGGCDSRVRGENFGQRPFRFAFEKMFDPSFRGGLVGRQVKSTGSGFLAHATRIVGLE